MTLLEQEVEDPRRPDPEQGPEVGGRAEGGRDLGEWRPRKGQRVGGGGGSVLVLGSHREVVGRM